MTPDRKPSQRIQEGALSAKKTPAPPAPTRLVPVGDQGGAGAERVERLETRRCPSCGRLTDRVSHCFKRGHPMFPQTDEETMTERITVIPDPTPELAERHPDIDWSQGVIEGVGELVRANRDLAATLTKLRNEGWVSWLGREVKEERAHADRLAACLLDLFEGDTIHEWLGEEEVLDGISGGDYRRIHEALAEHKRRRDDG